MSVCLCLCACCLCYLCNYHFCFSGDRAPNADKQNISNNTNNKNTNKQNRTKRHPHLWWQCSGAKNQKKETQRQQ